MGRMRRFLIAVLLVTATALAQTPDEQRRAKELLSSPVLTERAWGAYWAGRLHIPSLNDSLVECLNIAQAYREADFNSEENAYVRALFDALIESGTLVPARMLASFAGHWPDEVLILLSRDQGNEDLLLAIRDQRLNQARWLAVNNLLLRIRSARFFLKTLTELQIKHQFLIVDHDEAWSGGGSGGGSVADGIRQLPKGFPPIALYQLVDFASEGYVLVAKGPRDVYYRRTVVPTNQQVGWGVPDSLSDRQQERLEYLAALNQTSADEIIQTFSPTSTIWWHGREDFTRMVDVDLDGQAARVQSFVAAAGKRGLGNLAGLRLRIVTTVEDHRRSATSSPPEVAPKEFVLR
jgi:hypothetical protein